MHNRIIIAITGATGQVYGIRSLELLEDIQCETHLILSDAAKVNLVHETPYSPKEVAALADVQHDNRNIGASLASGSFETQGMLVAPCSMKTLSNIANGNSENLITRAADVTLKEQRSLLLMPREKPFNRIHLSNLLAAHDAGATIYPPFPSFYQFKEYDLDAMITRTVGRALRYLGISISFDEWEGIGTKRTESNENSPDDSDAI